MSEFEMVNYISVGKTVGIYLTIDGEQVLFVRNQQDAIHEAIRTDREKFIALAHELGMTSGKRAAWQAYWNMAGLIRTTPIGDGEK